MILRLRREKLLKPRNIQPRLRHDPPQILRRQPLHHPRILPLCHRRLHRRLIPAVPRLNRQPREILIPIQRLLRPSRLIILRQLRRRHLQPQIPPTLLRQLHIISVRPDHPQPPHRPRARDRIRHLRPDHQHPIVSHLDRPRLPPHLPRQLQRVPPAHINLPSLPHNRPENLPIQPRQRRPARRKIRHPAPRQQRLLHIIPPRRRLRPRVRIHHRPLLRRRLILEPVHRPGPIPQRRRHLREMLIQHLRHRLRDSQPLHRRRIHHHQPQPLRHPLMRILRRSHRALTIHQPHQLRLMHLLKARHPRPDQLHQPMPRLVKIDLTLRAPRERHMTCRPVIRRMLARRLRSRAPHLQLHRPVHQIHDRPHPPALSPLEILDPLHDSAPVPSLPRLQHPIRPRRR